MITISLCMIVKNEEQNLAKCLDSVKELVDEIIIVDTNSTDKTKEIAYLYTDKVYDFEWINDFSAARNFAFSKATKEYQLWLDADDIILEKDRIAFKNLKETLSPEIDMVLMQYRYVKNDSVYSFYRERLVKRVNNYKWNDPVHEYIQYGDNYIMSEIAVTHKKNASLTDRNLKIYENQLQKNIPLSPRSMCYYAKELKIHGQYEKSILYYKKFLDSKKGIVNDNINACLDVGKMCILLNDTDRALKYFFRSFCFDTPKAEACCEIASIYKEKRDYEKAIYWYEFIFTLNRPVTHIFFVNIDCWNFIPAIELAVCYYNIGDLEKASFYNEKAGEFKENHSSVLYNREIFNKMKNNTK